MWVCLRQGPWKKYDGGKLFPIMWQGFFFPNTICLRDFVFFFLGMQGTSDQSRWQKLNKSLFEVSAVMNGKHAAIPEIKVIFPLFV